MAELRRCKADLTQQLSDLQQQHHQLGEQHASALQQLARAQQEAQEIQRYVACCLSSALAQPLGPLPCGCCYRSASLANVLSHQTCMLLLLMQALGG